ncbi:hypothetical protein K438DRAFT_621681 [Mycena galopus ATCC 62051]|nr:hypothetical protein K438DRAFT_621681 [Mycena galopus ATCC 62051]
MLSPRATLPFLANHPCKRNLIMQSATCQCTQTLVCIPPSPGSTLSRFYSPLLSVPAGHANPRRSLRVPSTALFALVSLSRRPARLEAQLHCRGLSGVFSTRCPAKRISR